jgi:hypothetical protein
MNLMHGDEARLSANYALGVISGYIDRTHNSCILSERL